MGVDGDRHLLVVQQGRQSREHLFKECRAWTKGIGEIWTAVGKASGMRGKADEPFKSRKGFGYRVRHGKGPATHQSGIYFRTIGIPRRF